MVDKWRVFESLLIIAGAYFAWWLVSQPAFSDPPDALWYVFVCGAIAICAMILPGISGSFILLILGKYYEITGIIKEVLKLKLSAASILLVATFASGCLIGLISFSKVLKWLLGDHPAKTMAVLCGFMLGSLRKIWPFQVDTTPEVEEFKHKKFELLSLNEISYDSTFIITIIIVLVSAAVVLLLDRYGKPIQELPLDESTE